MSEKAPSRVFCWDFESNAQRAQSPIRSAGSAAPSAWDAVFRWSARVLLAVCIPQCISSALALDLVRDGTAVAEVVLARDANRSQQLAAEDLQMFFEQMSGAKIAIHDQPSGNVKNVIYVGENEFTKKLGFDLDAVNHGGYRLLVSDNYAIVAGRDRLGKVNPAPSPDEERKSSLSSLGIHKEDDTGTWYAGSELLEQLGVRFYHPYENGTIVPLAKDLTLETQDRVRVPHALYREYFAYHTRKCPDFSKWLHRNRYGHSMVTAGGGHSTRDILSDAVREQYPQVMAKNKEGSLVRGRGAPKLTDPMFRKLSIDFLRASFEDNPQLTAMSLGMPDGLVEIDYEDSLAFPTEGKDRWGRYSDYVWDYWSWAASELKKTHPHKYLMCLAYAGYAEPPSDRSLVPDNVLITYCYWTTQLLDAPTAKPILERREKWLGLLGENRLLIWDYFLWYGRQRPPVPAFFFELLQQETQALDGRYLGKFIEGASILKTRRMWFPGLQHFLLYWQGQLFWEPDLDREQIMDEYFRLYFGPAAKEMKEFYAFSEYQFTHPNPEHRLNAALLRDHNEQYFEILTRARAQAGSGTVYDGRIAEIETEILPLRKQHESLLREGPDIRVKLLPGRKTLDGQFDQYGARRYFRDLATGEEIAVNATCAATAVTEDNSILYVIVECQENNMDGIKADCTKDDDDAIFGDDVVEVYLATPEAKHFKIVVNLNGAIYDETTDPRIIERDTLPLLWQSDTQVFIKKTASSWIVELAIPTQDFGKLGPSKAFTWGLQIGRTRYSQDRVGNQALCPTGGNFAVIPKWANLWSR